MPLNLPRLGKIVEKYMLDTLEVYRKTSETTDPITLIVTPLYTTIFTGKAFVAPLNNPNNISPGTDPLNTSIGGMQMTRIEYEVAVPLDSGDINPGDYMELITSHDPELLGKRFIITGPIPSTFATHRRLSAYMDQALV